MPPTAETLRGSSGTCSGLETREESVKVCWRLALSQSWGSSRLAMHLHARLSYESCLGFFPILLTHKKTTRSKVFDGAGEAGFAPDTIEEVRET